MHNWDQVEGIAIPGLTRQHRNVAKIGCHILNKQSFLNNSSSIYASSFSLRAVFVCLHH